MADVEFDRIGIEFEVERKILLGMIVSTNFLKELIGGRYFKTDLFQNDYAKILSKWVVKFFLKYKKCPYKHIIDIYNSECSKLQPSIRDGMDMLLESLSVEGVEQGINTQYLIDQAKVYFERRHIENNLQAGMEYLNQGDLIKAKEVLQNFKNIVTETSGILDPFDTKEIKSFDAALADDVLLQFPGALGDFFGPLRRSWLISFLGPEKRGKTHILIDLAFQCIQQRVHTLFVSLEMNRVDVYERIYQRLVCLPMNEIAPIKVPIIDCVKNQKGECRKPERTNKYTLIDGSTVPDFTPTLKYRPCSYCRLYSPGEFVPAYWFRKMAPRPQTRQDRLKKSENIKELYGDRFRVKIFPAMSANLEDIVAVVDEYEYLFGFPPSVLIIDYLDIIDTMDKRLSDRARIDRIWAKFKGLAQQKNMLVITAEQGNKKSNEREYIQKTDVAEDKRKNAHVNLKYAINQTADEEENGITRIGRLLSRSSKTKRSEELVLLQSFELGQPSLDSYIRTVNLKNVVSGRKSKEKD